MLEPMQKPELNMLSLLFGDKTPFQLSDKMGEDLAWIQDVAVPADSNLDELGLRCDATLERLDYLTYAGRREGEAHVDRTVRLAAFAQAWLSLEVVPPLDLDLGIAFRNLARWREETPLKGPAQHKAILKWLIENIPSVQDSPGVAVGVMLSQLTQAQLLRDLAQQLEPSTVRETLLLASAACAHVAGAAEELFKTHAMRAGSNAFVRLIVDPQDRNDHE